MSGITMSLGTDFGSATILGRAGAVDSRAPELTQQGSSPASVAVATDALALARNHHQRLALPPADSPEPPVIRGHLVNGLSAVDRAQRGLDRGHGGVGDPGILGASSVNDLPRNLALPPLLRFAMLPRAPARTPTARLARRLSSPVLFRTILGLERLALCTLVACRPAPALLASSWPPLTNPANDYVPCGPLAPHGVAG
jgi:hypothetical protein